MKRMIVICVIICLCFSLFSCSKQREEKSTAGTQFETALSETETTTEAVTVEETTAKQMMFFEETTVMCDVYYATQK